jgi:hypothetical protein
MKTKSLLMIVAVVALAITGCQKEKNKLDKRLTKDEWKLSGYSLEEKEVTQNEYSVSSPFLDNYKNTETRKETFNGSIWTTILFEENINGNATSPNTDTYTYSFSSQAKFNEDGTYTITTSKARRSSKIGEGSGTIYENTYTDDPTVETVTGYWVWGDNTSTKEVIFIDGLGQYTVELSKDELKLSRVNSSSETEPIYEFISNARIGTRTSTQSSSETWTWGK